MSHGKHSGYCLQTIKQLINGGFGMTLWTKTDCDRKGDNKNKIGKCCSLEWHVVLRVMSVKSQHMALLLLWVVAFRDFAYDIVFIYRSFITRKCVRTWELICISKEIQDQYYCELCSLRYTPAPHICPTYFHNQNITDCSDQKWKGPSSLHR